MMRTGLSLFCIVVILICQKDFSHAQDEYDGHYDLKARDAAFLCFLMDDYLKTGKQPSLTKITPDKIDKETFTKGHPCWKFMWVPCDAATYQHTTQRPCGWYQMVKAPEKDC